jgi:hypothetical protein
MIEHKLDKRSTVIGTPHWMAPELFSATPSYGKEVDIWAFGSMVFEVATGLPPNVANGIPFDRLGIHLKNHVPRLEGGNYSNDLRDLVAFCLEELPSERPSIERVQEHPYINNTAGKYPASSLSLLVRAFKQWEDRGGSRKSLFMVGGAQRPSMESGSIPDDEWNFSTTATFDQDVQRNSTVQDLYEAYGTNPEFDAMFNITPQFEAMFGGVGEASRAPKQQKPSRRRPPPEALSRLPAPLEKIFDPNTLSNYEDNSKQHYGRQMAPRSPTSDLPLRADSAQTSIRESMIDLGGHDSDTGLSNFPDMETIKAGRRIRDESDDEYATNLEFGRAALSDPADTNPNRRTQDWKFPSVAAAPASADWKFPMNAPASDPEVFVFPAISSDISRPSVTPGSGARPALVHHETEPVGSFGGGLMAPTPSNNRLSMRESLIDLDMGMIDMGDQLPDLSQDTLRPSTASSEVSSSDASESTSYSHNPFEFEKHASMVPHQHNNVREPSIYVTEDSNITLRNPLNDLAEVSDFSASDAELQTNDSNENSRYRRGASFSDSDQMPPPPRPAQYSISSRPTDQVYTLDHLPPLPIPPSSRALSGEASHDEMKDEILRMLGGLTSELDAFRDVYSSPQVTKKVGPKRRGGDKKPGNETNGTGGGSHSADI